MRLTPEGLPLILPAALLAALGLAGWLALGHRATLWLAFAAGLLTFFLLYFFRDPDRKITTGSGILVSPADGRVVIVAEVDEPSFIQGRARQISIFMSPLDVHVNRIPHSGRVSFKKYFPGKFIAAYKDKASTDNEQMHLGIETDSGRMLVKQIAGMIARRIVCYPTVGEEVITGQRMGMIKLGSRVDVLMPVAWRASVLPGQRVRAGETVIATICRPQK